MEVVKAFPVDEPIRPEGRLIGRASAVEALSRQVLDDAVQTRMAAGRREGKTSLALAVLDRGRRRNDWWVLEADLSKHGPLNMASRLAEHLAEQARTAKVGIPRDRRRLARALLGSTAKLESVAKLIGVHDLTTIARAAEAVDAMLAPSEHPEPADLRKVLVTIEAAASGANRRVVVLIDEAHRLITNWSSEEDADRVKDVLSEAIRRPEGRTIFLIAGSENRVMEKLFGAGSSLEFLCTSFELPEIAREDWVPALHGRFREVELHVADSQLARILDATGGHPQRTMRACARVRAYCVDGSDQEISDLAVENGIREGLQEP